MKPDFAGEQVREGRVMIKLPAEVPLGKSLSGAR